MVLIFQFLQLISTNGTLTSLDTRLDNAETAIDALEDLTNSINGTLDGTVKEIQVGSENLAVGPIYESLLKRVDHKAISGYVEAFGSNLAMPTDPVQVTNASPTVTYTTSAAHGLSAGDTVLIADIASGKGWGAAEVNGEFTIATAPTTTTFTVTMSRNSTKTGTFGGASGITKEVLGRGLGRIWESGDGDDVAVRVGNPRGKNYNFIIVENGSGDGFVCYSKTDSLANFATLSGVGCQTNGVATGNCACK